ncbi:MAG TPA: CopD family protein [Rhodocyclaceae bacterium]|nr:CopD family protein [Rhodocyclaceae bacterium]
MNTHLVLLFLHLLGISIWIGGMFFAYVCLRPAGMLLEPPQRLPLMHAALGRFFQVVLVIVIVVLISGLFMMARVGFADAPKGWHWMMTSGIVMMLIFGHIYGAGWRRLGRAIAASDWVAGGVAMHSIRRLVGINLLLGILTIAFATIGSPF